MQYGICGNPGIAGPAAQAGYDYFEWSVGGFLKPREDEAAFTAALEEVHRAALPCLAVNVFVPADLKITGPAVDLAALEQYVTVACRRTRQAGVEVIVFGSGGARRIPEGFDRAAAWRQLQDFVGMLAPIAAAQSVTIAVEPLHKAECNVLTTVGECARLVREINHPAIRLLVDAYHLLKDGDSLEDVVSNGDLLVHVHIATVPDRLAPGMQACDLQPFFAALKRSGYHGRISIEGNLPEDTQHLHKSLLLMKSYTEKN
jgi:sugar phosphate isomerase/epimerase